MWICCCRGNSKCSFTVTTIHWYVCTHCCNDQIHAANYTQRHQRYTRGCWQRSLFGRYGGHRLHLVFIAVYGGPWCPLNLLKFKKSWHNWEDTLLHSMVCVCPGLLVHYYVTRLAVTDSVVIKRYEPSFVKSICLAINEVSWYAIIYLFIQNTIGKKVIIVTYGKN